MGAALKFRLSVLEPEWLCYVGPNLRRLDPTQLEHADGIIFLCPKCFAAAGEKTLGVHSVICWFVGRVPAEASPGPGRWTPKGTGFSDLTFVPAPGHGAVSVALTGGCEWHGFIRNGDAIL